MHKLRKKVQQKEKSTAKLETMEDCNEADGIFSSSGSPILTLAKYIY